MKMERISEMDDAVHLKRNDESLHLTILLPQFEGQDQESRET